VCSVLGDKEGGVPLLQDRQSGERDNKNASGKEVRRRGFHKLYDDTIVPESD